MSTDQILDDLIHAQQALDEAEREATDRAAERDQALARARRTGTGATELARLTGLTRARVYQILERAGLRD